MITAFRLLLCGTDNHMQLMSTSKLIALLATIPCSFAILAVDCAKAGPSNQPEVQAPPKVKLSRSVFETTIKAPREYVWATLTDFPRYPDIFPRMKSCQVLKREGGLVYLETHLKQQMFVKQEIQHTVNDLSGKPDVLKWKMLDGNFKTVIDEWKIQADPQKTDSCKVSYTLEVDPGPVIPKPMASMALKIIQKEIVANVKQVVENQFEKVAAKSTSL